MNNNGLRTVFLMTLVAVLVMFVGQLVAGTTGIIIAFVVAMGINFYSYWKSDEMVLKMYDAQAVDRQSHPRLYRMMEELRGVAAHELAHIKNRDILTSTVVATVVSALSMLAQFAYFIPMGSRDRGGNPLVTLIVLITAPIAAMLLKAAISRTREYEADREGARISGNPQQLASALQRIQKAAKQIPMNVSESAMRSTSHMFPVNPFSGKRMMSLFSTHPETEDRVERLMEMGRNYSSSY